jgi:hypothetical protein
MPSADVPENPFRHLGEREQLDGGFFRFVTGTFVGPDGFTFEREIVRHPGAVCIVALEDDHRSVLMIRQYRAAVDVGLLELPASATLRTRTRRCVPAASWPRRSVGRRRR